MYIIYNGLVEKGSVKGGNLQKKQYLCSYLPQIYINYIMCCSVYLTRLDYPSEMVVVWGAFRRMVNLRIGRTGLKPTSCYLIVINHKPVITNVFLERNKQGLRFQQRQNLEYIQKCVCESWQKIFMCGSLVVVGKGSD